jgi:putative transposase
MSIKYFKTSPEVIRAAVMMYIRFPLSLRNVDDLLHERGIDITRDQTPDRTVSSELAS